MSLVAAIWLTSITAVAPSVNRPAYCDGRSGSSACDVSDGASQIGRENVLLQHAVLKKSSGHERVHDSLTSSGRRRRRRRRRRPSSSKTRRRRRRRSPQTEVASTSGEPSEGLKADAVATSVEAGWADYAKTNEPFMVFVKGSNLDSKKDRIIVIHGEHKCGDATAKLATITGKGEDPGQDFAGWKSLSCDEYGSETKLSCGKVHWSDDGFVDIYEFKVCVCDHSKRGKCDEKADFDLTPTTAKLTLNPVI